MPFLTGSLAFGGLLMWWLTHMAQLYAGLSGIPTTDLPPALLHGPAMIYLGLAPFIFGFLLTVFPRWIGLPDLALRQFASVGVLLLVGAVLILVALGTGLDALLLPGFGLFALGWAIALLVLLREARPEDLDRRAEPARRHSHRVNALDLAHVEDVHGVLHELVDTHLEHPGRNLPVREVRRQSRDVSGLGHLLPRD